MGTEIETESESDCATCRSGDAMARAVVFQPAGAVIGWRSDHAMPALMDVMWGRDITFKC